ncbi:hypothetical protein K458DRAFT_424964 [Lentithecium fluviatile CBS 122367]|uniref:Uncharacterized protein n=1 Tax=Lentithecium fluviatile CBS 122367 TaxID=1168545 RepID=A0A6G1IDC9_9PLEO|nr:hypothetical protein K458DRAFT_424964 [Lentithecium fluviatile CBS 122367]
MPQIVPHPTLRPIFHVAPSDNARPVPAELSTSAERISDLYTSRVIWGVTTSAQAVLGTWIPLCAYLGMAGQAASRRYGMSDTPAWQGRRM